MDDDRHIEKDWQPQVFRCAVIGIALALILASLLEAAGFSTGQLLNLALATFVAYLVSRFDFEIPNSGSVFHPRTVFALWSAVMLGLFGCLIVTFAAAWMSFSDIKKPFDRVFAISREVVITFASALVFFFFIGSFTGPEITYVAGGFLIPNSIVLAAGAMATALYALSVLFDIAGVTIQGKRLGKNQLEDILLRPIIGHAAAFGLAISAFLVFNHFGMGFGLMVLPAAIAAHIAHKIHIRSLEQKTSEISEASRIHLATVEALATAIDARDQVGLGHVRRTQIYAVGIGSLLELSDDIIDALRAAALLHDVGKLAVPDHILNKPGQLTPAEMEKTKIHSSVGASMLEKVGFATPVVPTVKYHHEFWDGSGYPEGLRGSQIPLSARILAVADAFDTLRVARPYRPALSREDACSFLRAGAGNQFDPKIVDLFLRNLRSFEEDLEREGVMYEEDAMEPVSLLNESFVDQIKRANREVYTLYSLARDFGSAMGLKEMLTLFADKIRDFVPYDSCVIYLLDPTGDFADAVHVGGLHSNHLLGKRLRVGEGATGYALKKRKSVENVDPALDFAFTPSEELQDLKTMGAIPLLADDKLIGALSLYSSEVANYQDEHFRLLDTVSKIAADAIAKTLQHAQAETHALTDAITGLPNARSFQLEFDKELKRAMRSGSTFQLLMLDLDGFKAVNDTFGHRVGDSVLTALGKVIRAQLREYDFLARYAGDEFVALIPDTDDDSVTELCRRIVEGVSEFSIETESGERMKVGVSVGSAAYPAQGETLDQLVISADRAMYLMKFGNRRKLLERQTEQAEIVLINSDMIVEVGNEQVFSGENPPPRPELLSAASSVN